MEKSWNFISAENENPVIFPVANTEQKYTFWRPFNTTDNLSVINCSAILVLLDSEKQNVSINWDKHENEN